MPSKFPLDHWIKAVQWHGDSKVAALVNTEDEWADAQTLLTPGEHCGGGRVKAGSGSVGGISRTLSLGIFQLERTKKGSWYTGPRLHPCKKLWLSVASLEAQRPCRSPRWAGCQTLG